MGDYYQSRLWRVRDGRRQWGAEVLFLSFGPDLTYLTGPPPASDMPMLKVEGN